MKKILGIVAGVVGIKNSSAILVGKRERKIALF